MKDKERKLRLNNISSGHAMNVIYMLYVILLLYDENKDDYYDDDAM